MLKIGIVGTRSRDTINDLTLVTKVFFNLYQEGALIISGGCPKGGDRFAEVIAKKHGIPILIFYPDWEKHGKIAGFLRNTHIAQNSDILIACVASDRTGGTEDTIKKFKKFKPDGVLIIL